MATCSSASLSLLVLRACTTRPAGGPAARCSRARPCARQSRHASSRSRRPSSSRRKSPAADLDLGEYPLFDHFANLLVAGPGRVLAAVLGPRPQRELDDLVAEVLGVGDAGRLLDLGQLLIEQFAIEQLSSVRILEILILDTGIGIVDIAVEQVLPVVRIGLE